MGGVPKQCADFPHQSTLDPFFSESQFESYRALGIYVVREIIRTASTRSGERTNSGGQPGNAPSRIEQLILGAAADIAANAFNEVMIAEITEDRRRGRRGYP